MQTTKTETATMIEIEGQLRTKAVHQDSYPHLEGRMLYELNEINMLSGEVMRNESAGLLDFKLFHMKDNTNGVTDLLEATEFVGKDDEDILGTFCDFIKEYDTLGLSDVGNALVFIEGFETILRNPPTNFNGRALKVFMEHLEFLSADFVVVNSTITDLQKLSTEESEFVQMYHACGFRPYKGDADTYLFIQSNLINVRVQEVL